MNQVDTLIIGGGISGLSAAHFLNKRKINFLLLESSNRLGGVIKSQKQNNFVLENGPNTVLNNNLSIKKLINDCNLSDKMIFPLISSNSKRYVFHNFTPEAVPLSFSEFIKTPLIPMFSKIKFFWELISPFPFQNKSVYNFFSSKFGKEFHDNLIEPFLTGVYAGDTRKMSVKYCLRNLWSLKKKYKIILLGLIMSRKKSSNSFTFRNGLSEIIHTLEKNISKKTELNSKVESIKKNGNLYEIKTNSDKTFLCKNVICSIPAFSLSKIIFDNNLSYSLSKIDYNPIDVLHLGFKKKDIKKDINGFGILCKPSDNKSYLGVIFNSKIFPHICPSDCELFTVLIGGEKQKYILEIPKKKLITTITDEIRRLLNCEGKLVYSNHYHWEKGIPQYNEQQEELQKSIFNFHSDNKNFKITGNYFSGVSVSDCIMKSEQIIKEMFPN